MKIIDKLILILFVFSLLANSSYQAQIVSGKSYESAEGKIIGIWPHNDRFNSIERMKELKERWGFDYLLLAAIYDRKEMTLLKKAGYDSLHIAYQIYLPDYIEQKEVYTNKLIKLGNLWAYYFDEPISRGHSYLKFLNLLTFISDKELYPHAQFIVSELDEKKAAPIKLLVDHITYSGYGEEDKLGTDQIKSWREWRDYIGEKFSMLWVSALSDSNEYRTLFKAAKELKFNCVWFYALEPLPAGNEIAGSNYEKFCEAAVEFGFMKIRKKN